MSRGNAAAARYSAPGSVASKHTTGAAAEAAGDVGGGLNEKRHWAENQKYTKS
jgi:hypothetical protein